METLTKALETFDLHLVSIQREFCDKQSKYARALQQRHIAQRKAADEGGLVHKSSTNLDDFEYFEYLNAQEVQDLCAKQLMEHVQRYEVFWRIKLEAIIKTDLLAVLITGADADTLAKTTTARPEVPRFDMGTPKDEDKGSDEPDRKVKISKRAAAVNDEEFLQAQALYECAGARSSSLLSCNRCCYSYTYVTLSRSCSLGTNGNIAIARGLTDRVRASARYRTGGSHLHVLSVSLDL